MEGGSLRARSAIGWPLKNASEKGDALLDLIILEESSCGGLFSASALSLRLFARSDDEEKYGLDGSAEDGFLTTASPLMILDEAIDPTLGIEAESLPDTKPRTLDGSKRDRPPACLDELLICDCCRNWPRCLRPLTPWSLCCGARRRLKPLFLIVDATALRRRRSMRSRCGTARDDRCSSMIKSTSRGATVAWTTKDEDNEA
mmetsp:Transcript_12978/g.30850  ORF Transcript_12978/g.30850 Transcript_12978/m.30850 type:complete len:202 (+) Transcript_12978:927-1532(+)